MKKPYTKEETEEIIRRYPWDDTTKIAKDLGRSVNSVRSRAKRMKVPKMLFHIGKRLQNEAEYDINGCNT